MVAAVLNVSARLARMAERTALNLVVAGLIPTACDIQFLGFLVAAGGMFGTRRQHPPSHLPRCIMPVLIALVMVYGLWAAEPCALPAVLDGTQTQNRSISVDVIVAVRSPQLVAHSTAQSNHSVR